MAAEYAKRELRNLRRLVKLAKAEDLGAGDVTSALLPADLHADARFVARQELVLCGGVSLHEIAGAYDPAIGTVVARPDGDRVAGGTVLARWSGPARGILSAERVALNFLQRLSAVATATRRHVEAIAGTAAAIYDTRKTTPGWRDLEKYAVRVGGGRNHRRGLFDAVLVKDNHLALLASGDGGEPFESIARRLAEARAALPPGGFVEVEVDTLDQLRQALRLPVDAVLLDNMTPDLLRQAVAIRDSAGLRGRVAMEASGGVNLATVRAIAEAGVERISVGAITHSAPGVDIGLDVDVRS